jgi:transcriptional regulator with XRE-family HTH domain
MNLKTKQIKSSAEISAILLALRKQQKITIEDLSAFSGMHRNGISKIESAQSDPRISSVLELLQLLGAKLWVEPPNALLDPKDDIK